MNASIYREALGNTAWETLPQAIRDMHERGGEGKFLVTCRGLARVLAMFRFVPSGGEASVDLHIERRRGTERWIRYFNGDVFATSQRLFRGVVAERVGPFEVLLKVAASNDALLYDISGVDFALGPIRIPVPKRLLPNLHASERAMGARVLVTIGAGKSFGYTGHLNPR